MQDIRPFRGWRYSPSFGGDLSTLIAPPYDVVSPSQQQILYENSQFNVIRVELTAPDAADGDGNSDRHARARATLGAWRKEGILRQDESRAFYLYSQAFTIGGRHHRRDSIVAAVRLAPWSSGQILPHERTLSAPRAERLGLMQATEANVSPIWALYQDERGRVASAIESAHAAISRSHSTSASADGVKHCLDVVSSPTVLKSLGDALNETQLYIADGHHRYETALAYSQSRHDSFDSPSRFVMMVLTDAEDSGLIVLPTHRLIHGLDPERVGGLLSLLEKSFDVSHAPLPELTVDFPAWMRQSLDSTNSVGHVVGLLGARAGFLTLLQPHQSAIAALASGGILTSLTVWIAQKLVLEEGLGFTEEDIEGEKYLRYTRDASQARDAVESGSEQLALMLPATPVSQLLEIANASSVMPQKSTYFYPKPATGMVLRMLDEW